MTGQDLVVDVVASLSWLLKYNSGLFQKIWFNTNRFSEKHGTASVVTKNEEGLNVQVCASYVGSLIGTDKADVIM